MNIYQEENKVQIPDYIEPIVGYRYWLINDNFELTSVVQTSVVWPKRKYLKAECRINRSIIHGDNFEDCTCGNYAFKISDIPRLRFKAKDISIPYYIMGQVNLAGRIAQYSEGYKAELAYPKKLFIIDQDTVENEIKALKISDNYGIEVEVVSIFECFLERTSLGLQEYPFQNIKLELNHSDIKVINGVQFKKKFQTVLQCGGITYNGEVFKAQFSAVNTITTVERQINNALRKIGERL